MRRAGGVSPLLFAEQGADAPRSPKKLGPLTGVVLEQTGLSVVLEDGDDR